MRKISGLRVSPLVFWVLLVTAIGCFVLYRDLIGKGLTETQAYLVLGVLIYPVFYGCVLAVLIRLGMMLLYRHDYVRADAASVWIGRRSVPIADVQDIVVQQKPLGLSKIVIVRRAGSDIKLMGYTDVAAMFTRTRSLEGGRLMSAFHPFQTYAVC